MVNLTHSMRAPHEVAIRAARAELRRSARRVIVRTLWAIGLIASLLFSVLTLRLMSPTPFDWAIFVEAAERFTGGGLYQTSETYAYRYSPVLAPALAALGWVGPIAWRVLHVLAALALPSWRLRLVVLASWPFWFDFSTGNVMIFMFLAAAWALRGNPIAAGVFLAMTLLIPRPLMLPIAAWLLVCRPEWRMPFAMAFVLHAIAVLATGWGGEWIALLSSSATDMDSGLNLAPSRLIGGWWLAVAALPAAWLTWRGRLGWASLLAAPYWLPYYLMMPLLEVDRRAWLGTRARLTVGRAGIVRSTNIT